MKKKFAFLAAGILVFLTGCNNTSDNLVNRLSTTAVSNIKATAYEGAIVVTWNYGADINQGYILTRTSNEVEEQIAMGELSVGENHYVDYHTIDNQLENDKSYTYTIYTMPKNNAVIVDKAASKSVSVVAKSETPGSALKNWETEDISIEFKSINSKRYIVITRPDSYAYGYKAELVVDYTIGDDSTTPTNMKFSNPTVKRTNSTRKNGIDGTAQDYYFMPTKIDEKYITYQTYKLWAEKTFPVNSNVPYYKDSGTQIISEGDVGKFIGGIHAPMMLIEQSGQTICDITIMEPNSQSMVMLDFNEKTGFIRNMNDFLSNYDKPVMIGFDADGMLQSLAYDNLTIVFGNYKGNEVNLLAKYEDASELVTLKTDYDFDKIKQNIATINTNGLSARQIAASNAENALSQLSAFLLNGSLSHLVNTMEATSPFLTSTATISDKWNVIKYVLLSIWPVVSDPDFLNGIETIETDNGINDTDIWNNVLDYIETDPSDWGKIRDIINGHDRYSSFANGITDIVDNEISQWNGDNISSGIGAVNSGTGSLKVTLTWDYIADIDLHAVEPMGNEIYFGNKTSSTGGFLDVDNIQGGKGSTENVYWENPQDGTYTIFIHHYAGANTGTCRVTVFYKGIGRSYSVNLGYSTAYITKITLPSGDYSDFDSSSRAAITTEAASVFEQKN